MLVVDTNALNIIQNPADLKLIGNLIRQKMNMSPFQPSLPLDGAPSGDKPLQKRE